MTDTINTALVGPVRLRLITLDPRMYVTPPPLTGRVTSVHEVTLYDSGLEIHCCELTPSRELWHCYFAADIDDYDHARDGEALAEWLDDLGRYAEPVTYMHCRITDPGSQPWNGGSHVETIDDALDAERANPSY